jgi:P-type Ca2+ transporter type 2C
MEAKKVNWFNIETKEVIKAFSGCAEKGLSTGEANRRLAKVGHNQLAAGQKISPGQIFIEQFKDFMVLVLIGAAIVSGLLGERADAITIVAIVILNAILGFVQEYRAEKSLEALKELTAPLAHVYRDAKIQRIPAKSIVPGDILILESGDRIAADGRLIEVTNLEINEATLTGESLAVVKTEKISKEAQPALGDQRNMVFAGTIVSSGRGRAIVTATGMQTEIGKIAGMISTAQIEETPLQKRLEQLGKWLVVICLGICAAVGTMGVLRGEPPRQMFLAAVSLAVAAIPEGLPAIVTIALAVGVQKMIRRKAIIRRLPAVETLGCATVICSDKTGTLTQNKLAVTRLWAGNREYNSTGDNGRCQKPPVVIAEQLKNLLEIGVLCNNAQIEMENSSGSTFDNMMGDPTEAALLIAATHYGISPQQFTKNQPRLGEIPFSSERKRMSVWVNDRHGNLRLLTKGAADIILERCPQIWSSDGVVPLTAQFKTVIKSRVEEWGSEALRVLAFAYRPAYRGEQTSKSGDPETQLIFVGLMGMTDPPRPESRVAIEKSRRAGIQTKMITGDYPRTAAAIAKQIHLLRPNGKIITGAEMDQLSDEKLTQIIHEIDVFARVSPHHKLRVVKALKRNGEIVAMTGDGVNDAPAIKEADIGVAMGISGTDVTKEASAMIIADDNFATIVAAVEEGRTIYDNIRKFIRYLLSCNMGEILTMFGGIMLGLPFPLLPIQILWVNLVTDGLPAIALGMDPAERNTMNRQPRPPREGIFGRGLGLKIMFQGVMIGVATLAVYFFKLKTDGGLVEARTAAFATLVFAQLFFVFQCRSEQKTLLQLNPFRNLYLLGSVLISSIMQIAVIAIPWFQRIFYTVNLEWSDWIIILAISLFSTICSDLVFQFRSGIKKHLSIFHWETHRVNTLVGK